MAKSPYTEKSRLRHPLKIAAISGEFLLRNVALLTTVYGTGRMLTEIARMPIRTHLNGGDSTRAKSSVDALICYTGRERSIYWSNAKVVKAIDTDPAYRASDRHGVTPMATAFRGFDPDGRSS